MDRGAWGTTVHRMAKELDMKLTKCSTWSMNDSWYIAWTCPKWLPQIKKNLSLNHWTQCQVKVKVAQLCPTLCNPMYFTVHGILQARILDWAAYPFTSGSFQPRNQTGVTCIAGGFFNNWAMRVRSTLQNQSVQSLSYVRLFATPWTAMCQASLCITNSWSLLKVMSIALVMSSNHLILCHPLLLLLSIFPSIRVFSNELVVQVVKELEFQLQHQSFQWTFRTDFL